VPHAHRWRGEWGLGGVGEWGLGWGGVGEWVGQPMAPESRETERQLLRNYGLLCWPDRDAGDGNRAFWLTSVG